MAYKYQSYVWQSLNAIAMTLQSYVLLSSNGNIFCVTGPLRGESTGEGWIPLTKASDVELWSFLSCAPEKCWASNRDAGDFWRHSAHCNLIVGVMLIIWCYANDCPHRPRTITVSLPTKGDYWLTNLGIRSIHWLIFIFARCHHSTATLTHMKWMRDISENITYFYNGWK